MLILLILRDTALKKSPKSSQRHLKFQRVKLSRGSYYKVKSARQEADHWYLEFYEPIGGLECGYIYRSHAQLLDKNGEPVTHFLELSDDFASQIVRYVLFKRYTLEFGSDCFNIIYLVNYQQNGRGWRIVLDVVENRPRILGQWSCVIAEDITAYHIIPSQSKAWRISYGKLLQVQPLVVRDGVGSMNRGLFGIDQVADVNQRRLQIGNVMAAESEADHLEFIDLISHHRRYKESQLYVFRTTVLDLQDFERTQGQTSEPSA